MEEKFRNNSAITEVLDVHANVGAPGEALDRIKSCLKRDSEKPSLDTEQPTSDTEHLEQPSWIKNKMNKMAKLFKR